MAQPHNKKLGEYPMTTRGREQGPEKRYRRLRFPAFTAAKWTAANPLLQRGELGVETDTRKIKVGDGITYWNDLEYSRAETTWGEVNGDITDQTDLVEFIDDAVAAEAKIRAQADQQLQTNIDNVATDLTAHKQDTDNPHNVTKAQVGLGNVDNTSDADKPVSTAQAAALDAVESNLQSQITSNDTDISNLQNNKADKATDFETPITETNKGATMKEIEEVQTTSIKFKGYVSTTQPASDAYLLVEGNMWINAATMPPSFPVPASSIRVWDGSAWQTTTESYTPDALDAWSNLNNNEGYYWFGAWKVFSTDLSTEYFTLNQTSGLWEIKQSIHLPGTPTVDTPDGTTPQAIVNVDYVNTRGTIDNKITNCVLQIPQNINLELNNGTLTLKAGSKVYFPDGSFVNINSDKTVTPRNTNQIYVVDRSGNPVQWALNGTYSGDTAPTAQQYMLWFDTANNIIKRSDDTGATWTGNYSFPIGIFGPDDNENLAIKQVFNGFGFIGNSIFALPGVVALTPNGRNEDGSLNNTKVIVSNVIVRTFQNTLSQNTALYISNTYISTLKAPCNYNFETNYNMNGQNVFNACHIGTCQLTQGTVSNFMIKNTFRAVDYWGFNKLVKEVGNAAKLDAPNNFTSTNNSFANQILIRQNNGFAPVNIGYNSNGTQFSIHSVLSSGRGATVGVDADGTYCSMPTPDSDGDNIANTAWVRDLIERILGTMDYPVYWDYADATDHSHAMPGVQLDAETHQWYVYYKSGRVRQGGTYVNQETRNGTSHVMVTFPVEMANIYYEFQPSGVITSNGDYGANGGVTNDGRSTTQASLYFCDYVGAVTIAENYMSWSVDGMAADGPKNVTF